MISFISGTAFSRVKGIPSRGCRICIPDGDSGKEQGDKACPGHREKDRQHHPDHIYGRYFQAYENGYPLSSICRDICQDILTREPPRLDMGKVQDYEQIKENLRLRLVSREDNRKYLEQGPYRMDTIGAMVVYADLDESLMGQEMGMRITHRLLQGYGVTEGQLFDEAMTQTRMHCPFTLQSMDSLIEEMTGMRGPAAVTCTS